MADNTMATVLFISVFIFLFFKFCLGVGPLGVDAAPHLGEQDALNMAAGPPGPLEPLGVGLPPLTFKCPLGSAYSVATGSCKDLVRSSKSLTERLQLLMPYFSAAASGGRADRA